MAELNITEQILGTLKNFVNGLSTDRFQEILFAILFAFIGFFIARVISNTFTATIGSRLNLHQRLIWRRGIFYFIFILFLIASLREAGFKLSVFLGAAGILTVALGFASQTSASNLISGLFLIGEGAFEVGDTIQLTLIRGHTIEGKVLSIDLLSVKLQTLDNTFIRVPNEQLIRAPFYNLTRFPIRRIPITLFINFHEDIVKVRQVMIDVADNYSLVLDEPRPMVAVTAFRESSIELLFTVWTLQKHYIQVHDEMQERIRNGFIDNDIEIPIPKMGLVERQTAPLTNEDIDQYANKEEIKREPR
ncbi:mechanosensitive ion channel family protein [Acinetobacter populi]|jgi:small-conductance mechanosensitive channel|uniref:Small-conductance mechanosensitive channel n=1 Tax=Acinetobacter populi TaxID=1582270 RepID=A0A1Z9Z1P3_9GAMM|nr:mechanosensitive ion channel family protein [Acinetobacter populi]MCH4246296.1 mechanosensitive ion channel family protein [Acinetobacter populi]OUY08342.1 mechanosensitive ion channel protein [Acinetobacter populi]